MSRRWEYELAGASIASAGAAAAFFVAGLFAFSLVFTGFAIVGGILAWLSAPGA